MRVAYNSAPDLNRVCCTTSLMRPLKRSTKLFVCGWRRPPSSISIFRFGHQPVTRGKTKISNVSLLPSYLTQLNSFRIRLWISLKPSILA